MKSNIKKLILMTGALTGMMSMSVFAAGTNGGSDMAGFGTYGIFIWLAVMLALLYFMIIRPQKKKEKADRQLRASLQAGDKIVTIGGFTGRILSVKDDEVTFETGAAKTRLTIKKWAIQTREGPEVEAAEENTEEGTEESK